MRFLRAKTVNPGEAVTSEQHNSLARAVNERILSGVGDFPHRHALWGLNLVSQIRNPDGALWPAVDEWMKAYAHVDRGAGDDAWPDEGPGEPAGVNLVNPLGALVHGADWAELLSEESRTREVTDHLPFNTTLLAYWEAAKAQRGGIDLAAGKSDAPALRTAGRHYQIGYQPQSYYLKTYGGFFPSRDPYPEGCGDATVTEPQTPITWVRFTPFAPNDGQLPLRQWKCCCPSGSPGAAMSGMIAGVGYAKTAFLIYTWGTHPITGDPIGVLSEVLDRNLYYEGPYDGGGYLQRGDGAQLDQTLHFWIREFRGSDAQRADPAYEVEDFGFDFQEFLTRQYPLAPARGTYDPESDAISTVYPTFSTTTSQAAGYQFPGSHTLAAGYVLAGFTAVATGLKKDCRVEIQVNGQGVAVVVVTSAGEQSALLYLRHPPTSGVVTVRVLDEISLESYGAFSVQLAELASYKPQMQDAALVVRIGSSTGGDAFGQSTSMDTMGNTWAEAKRLGDDLIKYGCITGQALPITEHINENPIHESARRYINANLRLADRTLIRGYEVDGQGRSVLYFARHTTIDDKSYDVWRGIGPSRSVIVNGQIRPGVLYKLTDGYQITYNSQAVTLGQTFTGVYGVSEWETGIASGGNEVVKESEGIRPSALKGGRSNRWCCFISSNVYHTAAESLWKPELHDNSVRLNQRCHLYSERVRKDSELRWHFAYGQKPVRLPETVPGHLYAHDLIAGGQYDSNDVKARYYRSCQIYPAPYEVESVTDIVHGGEAQVKVVLTGRLRHSTEDWHPTNRDTSTWSSGNVTNRLYRTDENTLIQYLYYVATGTNCTITVGDYALNPTEIDVVDLDDNPFGSCFPRIYFNRLVDEVYEDGNKTEDAHDALVSVDDYHQIATYLRVMCEGWVDEPSSLVHGCKAEGAGLVDYNFERLLLDASAGKWRSIPMLPLELRPDRVGNVAHAPVVNTIMYAEVFNLLAAGVNLLTKARVDLPMQVESRLSNTLTNRGVTPNILNAGTKGVHRATVNTLPDAMDPWSDWDADIGTAGGSAQMHAEPFGEDPFTMTTTYAVVEYRFKPLDPLAILAIPDAIRPHLEDGSAGFLGLEQTSQDGTLAVHTTEITEAADCHTSANFFWTGSEGWSQVPNPNNYATETCAVWKSGRIDPPAFQERDYFAGDGGAFVCEDGSASYKTIVPVGTNFPVFIQFSLDDIDD